MVGVLRILAIAALLSGPLLAAGPCDSVPILPDEQKDGTLNSRDCSMSDAFQALPNDARFVDLFTVEIARAGKLTIAVASADFTPELHFTGEHIPPRQGGAELAADLRPGRYTIYVTSQGAKAGGYRLTTSFKADEGCLERPLKLNQAVAGDLRRGECRHSVVVPQRGTLTVELASGEASVSLIGARGKVMAETSGAPAEVEPGRYTIAVRPLGARAGAYKLSTIFCPEPRRLQLGVAIPSTMESGCLTADGARVQRFTLETPSAVISVDLSGHSFQPALSLSGSGLETAETGATITRTLSGGTFTVSVKALKGGAGPYTIRARVLCQTPDLKTNTQAAGTIGAAGCTAGPIFGTKETAPAAAYRLQNDQECAFLPVLAPADSIHWNLLEPDGKFLTSATLKPGAYTLVLSTAPGAPKPYMLDAACRRVCSAQNIGLADAREGSLTETDCLASEILGDTVDGRLLARQYRLTLAQPATVDLALDTPESAASMLLWERQGGKPKVIDRNRPIKQALPAGEYFVLVTSPKPSNYTLLASVPCVAAALEGSPAVRTELSADDCYDGTGPYYKQYRIRPDRALLIDVAVTAAGFDPGLRLLDKRANTTVAVTGAAGQRPARLQQALDSDGDYVLLVDATEAGKTGAFELTHREYPLHRPQPDANSVVPFEDSDCQESSCVHYYRVQLQGSTAIQLNVKDPFNSSLELLDSKGTLLETGRKQIVRSDLKLDNYVIRVLNHNRSYGSYSLSVSSPPN